MKRQPHQRQLSLWVCGSYLDSLAARFCPLTNREISRCISTNFKILCRATAHSFTASFLSAFTVTSAAYSYPINSSLPHITSASRTATRAASHPLPGPNLKSSTTPVEVLKMSGKNNPIQSSNSCGEISSGQWPS